MVRSRVLTLGLELLDNLAGLHALSAHLETSLLKAFIVVAKLIVILSTFVRTWRHGAFVSLDISHFSHLNRKFSKLLLQSSASLAELGILRSKSAALRGVVSATS